MGLRRQWSPEQIAGWLKRTYPGEPQNQVSHETIYRCLFIQARGVLKKKSCFSTCKRNARSAAPDTPA
jgi:IS30 family transposase